MTSGNRNSLKLLYHNDNFATFTSNSHLQGKLEEVFQHVFKNPDSRFLQMLTLLVLQIIKPVAGYFSHN